MSDADDILTDFDHPAVDGLLEEDMEKPDDEEMAAVRAEIEEGMHTSAALFFAIEDGLAENCLVCGGHHASSDCPEFFWDSRS
jgi:hypothetical protein